MIELWTTGNFWDKLYVVFAVIMLMLMIKCVHTFLTNGASKKLEFILKAQEEGRCVPGKLTCLTREGKQGDSHYCAEYMYVVNDKRYFVTYRISPNNVQKTNSKDEENGDILALDIQKYPMLFYDAKKPEKVFCKADIYTSFEAFAKDITSKNNIYRDIEKDWVEAIDLVKY